MNTSCDSTRNIDTVPGNIIHQICCFLTQSDIVNLVIACPNLQSTALPSIYRCIVIDPTPRSLHEVRALRQSRGQGPTTVTYTCVNTVYGIKKFFSAVEKPEHAAMVHSLVCRGNLSVGDNELILRLCKSLQNLINLEELEWQACPELPPSVLAYLPRHISSLCIDIASRSEVQLPNVRLPNLRRFHVRPFLNLRVLSWLTDVTSESVDLEDVSLSRFLDNKEQVGSSYTFLGTSDVNFDNCTSENVPVSLFFSPFSRSPLELKSLALTQVDLTVEDSKILSKNINLKSIKQLTLLGTGNESNFFFLELLAEAKPQLTHLHLDWKSVPSRIISKLLGPSLISLQMHVYNEIHAILNDIVNNSPNILYLQLSNLETDSFVAPAPVIGTFELGEIPVVERPATLTDDANNNRILYNLNGNGNRANAASTGYNLSDLEPLQKLKKLVVLDIPYKPSSNNWLIAYGLPSLKVLKLKSSVNQRGPGGLLTNGLLDQWNNHLCSPLQYKSIIDSVRTTALDYLCIAGTVICLNYNAPPIESYDQLQRP